MRADRALAEKMDRGRWGNILWPEQDTPLHAFAFTVIAFGSLLFSPELGAMSILVFIGVTFLMAGLLYKSLPSLLVRQWTSLIFPVLAFVSVAWSLIPELTIRASIQLFITVFAAMMISNFKNRSSVIYGFVAIMIVYMLISFAQGRTVSVGNSGDTAFAGMSGGKNYFAALGVTGLLAGVSGAWFAALELKKSLVFLGVAAALLGLIAVVFAKSSGAVMAAAVGLIAIAAIYIFSKLRLTGRVLTIVVVAILILPLAINYALIQEWLNYVAFEYFNKDPTLTGRIYLWERAQPILSERPLLGYGFNSFWVQGNLDAEGLWRYASITSRQGFNFHNTPIEIRLYFGWIGLAICSAVFALLVTLLLIRVVRKPDPADGFWLAILLGTVMKMPIESLIPWPFQTGTLLFFAALGQGAGRIERLQPVWRKWRRPIVRMAGGSGRALLMARRPQGRAATARRSDRRARRLDTPKIEL